MKTIDIVEGYNKFFESMYPNRGHFVSKLNIEQNKIIKALKTYTLEVWYVKDRYKDRVFYIEKTDRISESNEENIIRDLNIELTRMMFKNYSNLLEYGVQ